MKRINAFLLAGVILFNGVGTAIPAYGNESNVQYTVGNDSYFFETPEADASEDLVLIEETNEPVNTDAFSENEPSGINDASLDQDSLICDELTESGSETKEPMSIIPEYELDETIPAEPYPNTNEPVTTTGSDTELEESITEEEKLYIEELITEEEELATEDSLTAESQTPTASGIWGGDGNLGAREKLTDDIQWAFYEDTGLLTLTGTGGMPATNEHPGDYDAIGLPWYKYQSKITQVSIGEGITQLGAWALSHSKITEVTLPSTLKSINNAAFAYCYDLKTVHFNAGLEKLDSWAFYKCTSLTGVVLPDSLREIGTLAFCDCALDSDILFPASLTTVGDRCFEGSGVTRINLPEANHTFLFEDQILYSADKKKIFFALGKLQGTLTIPSTVTEIEDYAFFSQTGLTSVALPDGLGTIGGFAFFETGLTKIIIPDSVKEMRYDAFSECFRLKSVKIGAGLTELDIAVFSRTALEAVEIPGNIKKIGQAAFSDCFGLTKVTLSEGIETLDDHAFQYCKNLASIKLPSTLTSIGSRCFYNTAISSAEIPKGVTHVGAGAFPDSASVIYPAGLSTAGDGSHVKSGELMEIDYSVTYEQKSARSMLSLINSMRTGRDAWYYNVDGSVETLSGLGILTYDYDLEQIAMERAAEIAIQYSHTRPDGRGCFSAKYHNVSAYGENLTAGRTTVQAAFESWCETNESYDRQGHRRNMLDTRYNTIGIAHVVYRGCDYWVQEFGYRTTPNTTRTNVSQVPVSVSKTLYVNDVTFVSFDADTSTILLPDINSSVTLPAVTASIKLSDTWPGPFEIPINAEWKSANPGVAKIDGNNVIGIKNGATTITGTAYGHSVNIKVQVGTSVIVPTPSSLHAVNGRSGIELTWKQVSYADGYSISRKIGNGAWKTIKKINSGSTLKYTDSSSAIANGTTVYYRVRAYKSNVYSKWSSKATIFRLKRISLKKTENVSGKRISIAWTKNKAASGYEYYWGTEDAELYAKTGRKVFSKMIGGLEKGETYSVKVRCYKTVGKKTYYSAWATKKIKIVR